MGFLGNGDAARIVEMNHGVEASEEIESEQAVNRTFSGQLMTHDGDRTKRALKKADPRNDE